MVNKSDYIIQVLQILVKNDDKSLTQKEFENLYDAASGEVIEENPHILVDRVVNYLFNDKCIPWNFFITPVGEIIGRVRFQDDTLLLPEIAEILDCSIQNVHKVKEELKAKQRGRNWKVKESNFDEWLKKNGKPSLWELRKKKEGNGMRYDVQEERIINPGFETESEYK